ncbi:MAG TPA: hypothetical protein VJZ26_18470 [Blastocatellia bacterium]|nr:hypothetical protein [Blastocatellia bacterium]
MSIIKTNCPACQSPLEFPRDFDNIICSKCETAFQVREYKGVINLSQKSQTTGQSVSIDMDEGEALEVIESRLAELDEMISEAGSEVEALRSREQSGPLQMGCSFFGLFVFVITVIVGFMPLGRRYFGNWLFYLAIAIVILLGLQRIRRRQASPAQIEQLRAERLSLEDGLRQLEAERDRIRNLRARITPYDQEPGSENGGS